MFFQRVKRFLIRLSIYQIILLWSIIKVNNVEKHAGEFKDKIIRNLSYFNPLLPESQFSLYNIRNELFYNIGIFIGLILVTYYPYEDTKQGKIITPQIENDEENEDEDEEDQEEEAGAISEKNQNKSKK